MILLGTEGKTGERESRASVPVMVGPTGCIYRRSQGSTITMGREDLNINTLRKWRISIHKALRHLST